MEPPDEVGAQLAPTPAAAPGGRLRVVLDLTPAARQRAGIGRYTRELGAALVERNAHHYRVFVADRGHGPLDLAGRRVAPRYAPVPGRLLAALWHRLRLPLPAEVFAGRADVYHAMDFLAPPLVAARSVVTVHDLSFLRHPEAADAALARHLARRLPPAVRAAHHVLVDSDNTRRDVLELLGISAERVSVAYPGVRGDFGDTVDWERIRAVREKYCLPGPYLLGVGTIEPRKDWQRLIEAFAAAPPGTTLAIAGGPGWRMESIEAAAWNSRSPVRLLGFVTDADLAALYHGAAAFAYPSRYEGFGLPPLEAMAAGVPCLVSDAGSLPEAVGSAALVVAAGDDEALARGVARILTDRELRTRLRVEGPRRAARFTWAATAAVAEAAYRRAARRRAPGPPRPRDDGPQTAPE
ncbi:MAG: glycosyltransferase family 4 protein [Anaerolineae bacterium]